jgi:hypothetical protein
VAYLKARQIFNNFLPLIYIMTEKEIQAQREAAREAQIIAKCQKLFAPQTFIKKHKRTHAAARGLAWAAHAVSFASCGAFAGGLAYLSAVDYVGSTGAIIAGVMAGAAAGWLIENIKADSVKHFFVGLFSGEGSGAVTKVLLIGGTILSLGTSFYGVDLFGTATAPTPEIYQPKYEAARAEDAARYDKLYKSYLYGGNINNKDKPYLAEEKKKLEKYDELEAVSRKEWESAQAAKVGKFQKYENIIFFTVLSFEVLFLLSQCFIFWFAANAQMMGRDTKENVSLPTAGADSPTQAGGGEPPQQPEPAKNIDIINMHNIQKLKSLYASYRYNFKTTAHEATRQKNAELMALIEKRLAELGELPPADRGAKVAPRQIGF